MKRVAIFYCKRIKDHTCIACAKCFKGVAEGAGQFAGAEPVEIAAMTDCGDCPGLLVPRAAMVSGMLDGMGRSVDAIYLGTCMRMACEHGECPLDLEVMQKKLQEKLGKPVIIGTHPYV